MKHKKKDANTIWRTIHAVNWADFAGSSCIRFGFTVTKSESLSDYSMLEWLECIKLLKNRPKQRSLNERRKFEYLDNCIQED